MGGIISHRIVSQETVFLLLFVFCIQFDFFSPLTAHNPSQVAVMFKVERK